MSYSDFGSSLGSLADSSLGPSLGSSNFGSSLGSRSDSCLSSYLKAFSGKRVGFVGLGVSNLPVLKLFAAAGAVVSVRDLKPDKAAENAEYLRSVGARVVTGSAYLENIDEETLFLSPGVKQFLPRLEEAAKRGVTLTTEMQEFLRLCPCRVFGITGSDGKTTTATLVAKLLEEAGKTVHLGGNIGECLFAKLDDIKPDDFVVAELSSFQLMKMSRSPDVAVITNISPNHLDWHRSMREYADAKKNILLFQNEGGKAVLNASDAEVFAMREVCRGEVVTFGAGEGDFRVDADGVHRGGRLLLSASDILLPGAHNRLNYAAALAATEGIVTAQQARKVARSFAGVEHRIEFVREKDGVKYYNSSIDTSPSRTAAALRSFSGKLIVIAGGYDKNIPLEPLGQLFCEKVKTAVLMGNTAPKIKAVLEKSGFAGKTAEARCMGDAVKAARSAAKNGDVVILSPAAASFDSYKNFEERGEDFKNIVNSL